MVRSRVRVYTSELHKYIILESKKHVETGTEACIHPVSVAGFARIHERRFAIPEPEVHVCTPAPDVHVCTRCDQRLDTCRVTRARGAGVVYLD